MSRAPRVPASEDVRTVHLKGSEKRQRTAAVESPFVEAGLCLAISADPSARFCVLALDSSRSSAADLISVLMRIRGDIVARLALPLQGLKKTSCSLPALSFSTQTA